MWFPGCPALHRDGDVVDWLQSYGYWNKHHKTPVDLGFVASYDQLNPLWFDGMDLIDLELARLRELEQQPRAPTPAVA